MIHPFFFQNISTESLYNHYNRFLFLSRLNFYNQQNDDDEYDIWFEWQKKNKESKVKKKKKKQMTSTIYLFFLTSVCVCPRWIIFVLIFFQVPSKKHHHHHFWLTICSLIFFFDPFVQKEKKIHWSIVPYFTVNWRKKNEFFFTFISISIFLGGEKIFFHSSFLIMIMMILTLAPFKFEWWWNFHLFSMIFFPIFFRISSHR